MIKKETSKYQYQNVRRKTATEREIICHSCSRKDIEISDLKNQVKELKKFIPMQEL